MKKLRYIFFTALLMLGLGSLVFFAFKKTSAPAQAQTGDVPWPMAGGNPQRTSWSSTEVKGLLRGEWAKPIDAYIPQKVQIVAADNKIFLSTAKGLYIFDATNGDQLKMYPTSMPLGHSPAYFNGTVYVAGFDRKIHAINPATGTAKWTFTAGGGFAVSPLVVSVNGSTVIYAGSRDGKMYAVKDNGSSGSLFWSQPFDTGAPIAQSAAFADNTIYFGSDNMFGYAVNATTGAQVWKSSKLPGIAMNSWWPVVNGSSVYFTVATNYSGKLLGAERDDMYGSDSEPPGTPYDTVSYPSGSHMTMDTSEMINYLNAHPGRRTLVILNRTTGAEKTPYAPALWGGMTGSLTRFPPVVDPNGTLYFRNNMYFNCPATICSSGTGIPGGMVTGWNEGSSGIQIVGNREIGGFGNYPIDEPGALAGGGSVLYHTHCCARVLTSYDTSVKNTVPLNGGLFPIISAGNTSNRQWRAEDWKITGYDSQFSQYFLSPNVVTNGGGALPALAHGDNNPPIPYNGRVYFHRGNALIALSTSGGGQLKSTAASSSSPAKSSRTPSQLQALLINEIQKIIAAGHLRPGLYTVGHHDNNLNAIEPYFLELFHNPAETYIVLLRALPHLPTELQNQLKTYLQNEWLQYPATGVIHAGFTQGTPREHHVMLESNDSYTTKKNGTNFINFYAAWKYAQVFGNATAIFNALPALPALPPSSEYTTYPQKLNEAIAGYYGYIELAKMTGNPFSSQQNTLNSLIAARNQNWSTKPANPLTAGGSHNYYAAPITINFMYIQPEFAGSLSSSGKAAQLVADYEKIFPYWFLAKGTETQGEGSMQPPQYYHGLFQAKARILQHSYTELESHLDAPAYAVGDLYYIDNIVAALDASGAPPPTSAPSPSVLPLPSPSASPIPSGDVNNDGVVDSLDITLVIQNFGKTSNFGGTDVNGDGKVNIYDYSFVVSDFDVVTNPSPTVLPSGSPPPGTSGLQAGTGQAVWANPDPSAFPTTAEANTMIASTVSETRSAFGVGTPKAIFVAGNMYNAPSAYSALVNSLHTEFGAAVPVVGAITGSNHYNPFTLDTFVEHNNRSVAAIALGGNAIENVFVSQKSIGGADGYYNAGKQLATALLPQLNANKTNLIHLFGPGHNPKHKLILCGMKEVFTDRLGACDLDPLNADNPEPTNPPFQVPSYIKIIGASSAPSPVGGSIYNGAISSSQVAAVLLQGTFTVSLSGKNEDPVLPTTIATYLTQMKTDLGGNPDVTFFVPGHPAAGTYATVKQQFVNIFGSATVVFGHEGGGETGHLNTAGQPQADVSTFFMVGLKATP